LARRKQFQIFEHWSKQLVHSGEGERRFGLRFTEQHQHHLVL
jgi:hypothetical protein